MKQYASEYQKRREAGLCVKCGQEAGGKAVCRSCALKQKACNQRRYQKRKEAKLCVQCGKPTVNDVTLCVACNQRHGEIMAHRYYSRKEDKVCYRCQTSVEKGTLCVACREKYRNEQRSRYRRAKETGKCCNCNAPTLPEKAFCLKCYGRICLTQKARNRRRRAQILAHYGTSCICCGESHELFLEVDHIHGGGNAHRREVGDSKFYKWLIDNNFPEGFRILCANCNKGKTRNGGICPHEEQRRAAQAAQQALTDTVTIVEPTSP